MNTLIVVAHPEPRSICAEFARRAASRMSREGEIECGSLRGRVRSRHSQLALSRSRIGRPVRADGRAAHQAATRRVSPDVARHQAGARVDRLRPARLSLVVVVAAGDPEMLVRTGSCPRISRTGRATPAAGPCFAHGRDKADACIVRRQPCSHRTGSQLRDRSRRRRRRRRRRIRRSPPPRATQTCRRFGDPGGSRMRAGPRRAHRQRRRRRSPDACRSAWYTAFSNTNYRRARLACPERRMITGTRARLVGQQRERA